MRVVINKFDLIVTGNNKIFSINSSTKYKIICGKAIVPDNRDHAIILYCNDIAVACSSACRLACGMCVVFRKLDYIVTSNNKVFSINCTAPYKTICGKAIVFAKINYSVIMYCYNNALAGTSL